MIKRTKSITIPALLMVMTGVHAHTLYEEGSKKLELTGKVLLERDFSKDKGKEGDASALRVGLKGEIPINVDGKEQAVQGFGHLELGKSLTADPIAVRTAVAGVKGVEFGSFSYGRMLGVMNDVTTLTSELPVFCSKALGDDTDSFGSGRTTGLVQYRTPTVQGMQLALQYLAKNSAEGSKEIDKYKDKKLQGSNGEGYGVALTHGTGMGVTWGIAYNNAAKSGKQKEHYHNTGKAKMFALGAKYDHECFLVAATYAQTRNQVLFNHKGLETKPGRGKPVGDKGIYANKTQGFEVVAQYKLPNGLKPTVGYLQSTATLRDDTYNTKERNVQVINVGATKALSNQLSLSADCSFNLLKKKQADKLGVSSENILGIGLTYTF